VGQRFLVRLDSGLETLRAGCRGQSVALSARFVLRLEVTEHLANHLIMKNRSYFFPFCWFMYYRGNICFGACILNVHPFSLIEHSRASGSSFYSSSLPGRYSKLYDRMHFSAHNRFVTSRQSTRRSTKITPASSPLLFTAVIFYLLSRFTILHFNVLNVFSIVFTGIFTASIFFFFILFFPFPFVRFFKFFFFFLILSLSSR
jgi:hypothetical protein